MKSIPELIDEFNKKCQNINFMAYQQFQHVNRNITLENLTQAFEFTFAYDLEKLTSMLNELMEKSEYIPNYERNLFDFEDGESISSITYSGSEMSAQMLSSAMSYVSE